jgi:7-cyano-7-deazaguanine synthase
MKKAICLFSGGMDSAVCLYIARDEGYEVAALSFDYGQRHEKEVEAAHRLTHMLEIPQHIIRFKLPWKGSALLERDGRIPRSRDPERMSQAIPSTYVPARNSIFLSFAFSCAEAENAEAVFFGANVLDYSGYPDCRPEYLEAFTGAMRHGTKAGVEGRKIEVAAPLLRLTKKEIVLLGQKLNVPFEKTWSCYAGGHEPCGVCDSCILRAKGFREAGIPDPLVSA